MTYQGKDYTDASPVIYFDNSREKSLMHETIRQELGYILIMLRDEGEEKTFRFLKDLVRGKAQFPWEE